MLAKGELSNALEVYWRDAARCFNSKAFWCLLHVTVSLPDVCAALESTDGNATFQRYKNWCDKYFAQPALNGTERYKIRCKVLHQGRARPSRPGRYAMFAFGQPHSSGAVDHLRVDGSTLHIDVGELYKETYQAIEKWIGTLEGSLASAEANNVAKNLPLLVRVTTPTVPVSTSAGTSFVTINKTN